MTLFLLGKRIAAQSGTLRSSLETRPAKCRPIPPCERMAREAIEALGSTLLGKRSSWGRGRLQLQGEKPTLGWVPNPSVPALFLAGREEPFPGRRLGLQGAAMSPSPRGEDSFPRDPSPPAAGRDAGPCPHSHSLSRLQGDDDEDGPPVHSSHAAAVAHEVVQDGGELGPHLPGRGEQALSRE